jgi:hypothetical protein
MTDPSRGCLRRILAAAAAATIACAAGASADQAIGSESPRVRIGPLGLTPRLVLEDLGVDSNIYNLPSEPESDFVFTLTPSIEVASRIRRAAFAIQSYTDFAYFATHADQRAVNQRLAGDMRVDFGRIAFFGHGTYRNGKARTGDEIDARTRQMELTAEAGVRWSPSPRIGVDVSMYEVRFEFDQSAVFDATDLADQLNHRENLVKGSFRYAVTPLTAVVLAAETGHVDFWRSPVRDAETWSTSIGVDLQPRALISGRARVGYQSLEARAGTYSGFAGLISTVDVAYRAPGSITLGAALDRMPSYSYFEGQPYYVVLGYRASARRQVSPRVDIDVRLRRAQHAYGPTVDAPDFVLVAVGDERIREDTVELSYRISPRRTLRAGLSYWKRESDLRDYRNFHGLRSGLTWIFDF